MVLRAPLFWLSERRGVFNFVKRNGLARKFASRFVAGETLDSAMAAAKDLNARDITASLDLLGESVHSRDEAASARDAAVQILDRIAAEGVRANVSVKLTQMGLDIDPALCAANMRLVLDVARRHETFVRMDMEGSAYTERTLALFEREVHPAYGDHVGVVIQSMLRRSAGDIDRLVEQRARVRLVKGAYMEPASVAFPDKRDVDASYAALTEVLLERGNYPALATHDERLIAHAVEFARGKSIGAERFEFQMLYGVRRDLQDRLRAEGYNVRVYVPYGTEWYPYLMRRLAERPANIVFIVGNVVKERLAPR